MEDVNSWCGVLDLVSSIDLVELISAVGVIEPELVEEGGLGKSRNGIVIFLFLLVFPIMPSLMLCNSS